MLSKEERERRINNAMLQIEDINMCPVWDEESAKRKAKRILARISLIEKLNAESN